MLRQTPKLGGNLLGSLHRESIGSPERIRSLLRRAALKGGTLARGFEEQNTGGRASIESLGRHSLVACAPGVGTGDRSQVVFTLFLDGRRYCFVANVISCERSDAVRLSIPTELHVVERRDRGRRVPSARLGDATRLLLLPPDGDAVDAEIRDLSTSGMGVRTRAWTSWDATRRLRVRHVDGGQAGHELAMAVRNHAHIAGSAGWVRIGLEVAHEESGAPVRIDFFPTRRWATPHRVGRSVGVARRGLSRDVEPKINVVDFKNDRGERIVAIVDSWGETRNAPAVIIPPAWGQTKEALLPLARTIVGTFRAHNRPVVVLRFDGTRRRGESHNDPRCRVPGREYHDFTFSQGVRDIEAAVDFLEGSAGFQPPATVLVTFSASSLDGRKAIALDPRRRITGWICVVGASDLQSLVSAVSGGIDYVSGVERGIRFGLQELLGVEVDIDRIGRDCLENGMASLEDSCRDLEVIDVPIVWFHGQHDGWMNLARIHEMLSRGDTRERRLAVIPTGHRLRTSHEASQAFDMIASELGRMVVGEEIPAVRPPRGALRMRRKAERQRCPANGEDLRSFWRQYLLGREGSLGIELLTDAMSYRGLMAQQIRGLELRDHARVADLGAGTGPFSAQLLDDDERPRPIQVDHFDHLREVLSFSRSGLDVRCRNQGLGLQFVQCDLSLGSGSRCIPARTGAYDAVLASLLLSYVDRPVELLGEVLRILRSGGRFAVSTLRRDADISKAYLARLAELEIGRRAVALKGGGEGSTGEETLNFLNDAARILQFEEAGVFHFWDADEFADLLRRVGFCGVRTESAFGDPPQAVVAYATSP
jgi:SAM-dependent methyltransferase